MLKKILFKFAVYSIPAGLISCTVSPLIKNPHPHPPNGFLGFHTTSNGMRYWKFVKPQIENKERPEFCKKKMFAMDAGIFNLNCYQRKALPNQNVYSITKCTYFPEISNKKSEEKQTSFNCYMTQEEEKYSDIDRERAIRFFGDGVPSSFELGIIEVKDWLAIIGFVIVFAGIGLFLVWILISILEIIFNLLNKWISKS